MKLIIPTAIALALFCLLNGCIYQPNDVYYYEVIPGEEPVLTFSSNLDTLPQEIRDSIEVNFAASVDVGQIYLIGFYFDDTEVYLGDTLSGSFWLNPSFIDSTGIYALDLNVYYSTNSGSLADVIGGEVNLYEKTWHLYYMKGAEQ